MSPRAILRRHYKLLLIILKWDLFDYTTTTQRVIENVARYVKHVSLYKEKTYSKLLETGRHMTVELSIKYLSEQPLPEVRSFLEHSWVR